MGWPSMYYYFVASDMPTGDDHGHNGRLRRRIGNHDCGAHCRHDRHADRCDAFTGDHCCSRISLFTCMKSFVSRTVQRHMRALCYFR